MRAKLIQHHLSTGSSLRASARAFGVSDKTVRKWLHRAHAAGFPPRLEDRSCAPLVQPRKTPPALEAQILMVLPVFKASRLLRTLMVVCPVTTNKRQLLV